MKPASVLLAFLGILNTAQAGVGISPARQDPLIRVETRRVLLDVMVWNDEGEFVPDLELVDFTVLENGKPRPLTNLLLIDKAGATARGLDTIPPAQMEFYEDRHIVVMDRVSMSLADFQRALGAVARLADEVPPNAQIGLFVFDGTLRPIQRFTNDTGELETAIARASRILPIRPLGSPQEVANEIASLFTERLAMGFQVTDTTATQNLMARTVADAVSVANRHLRLVDLQVSSFFRQMQSLVRSLRHVAGTKSLILFSRGYAMHQGDELRDLVMDQIEGRFGGPGLGAERRIRAQVGQIDVLDYHGNLSDLIGSCNRNQIRVYSLDPAGLQALPGGGDSTQTSQFFMLLNRPERKFFRDLKGLSEPADSIVSLSRQTNGLAFTNSNDLGGAVSAILDHNSRYYLLGYEPPARRKENRFYEVEVRLKRPGKFRVFAERGYLHSNEDEKKRRLTSALAFPGLFRQIPFDVDLATFFGPSGPVTSISLEIPGPDMPFARRDPGWRSDLMIQGFVLGSGGNEVGRFAVPYRVDLDSDELKSYRKKSFIFYHELKLPPGSYQLRTIIQDLASGRLGAAARDVEVSPRAPSLAVSDLVLSQDIRPVSQTRQGPTFVGSYRVVPEGDRRVRRDDPVYVFFHVYNLREEHRAPRASIRFQLADFDHVKLYESPPISLEEFTEPNLVAVSHAFPVQDLRSGLYQVKIEVEDHLSGERLARTIEFELTSNR